MKFLIEYYYLIYIVVLWLNFTNILVFSNFILKGLFKKIINPL